MAYTNVWTTAAPLNTQAANQGAADFRQLKLDVMQRITSFGQGLLANRPTPETTSGTADWGDPGGPGVMYWATDTKQVFGWTGTAWQDISAYIPNVGAQRFTNVVPVTITDDGSGHNGQIITIPANTMTQFGEVIIRGQARVTAADPTPISKLGLFFGGYLIAEFRGDTLAPGVFANDNAIDFNAHVTGIGSSVQQSYGTSQQALLTTGSGNLVYGIGNNPGADITSPIIVNTGDPGGINSGATIVFTTLSVLIFN